MKYKNKKNLTFKNKINQIIKEKKEEILKDTSKHLLDFDLINFEIFSIENPYKKSLKNKIFFTYNDSYNGNSSLNMSIEQLSHVNLSYEDRGYIKGVATDLNGYLKLKSTSFLNHNLKTIANIYIPKFQKSINQDIYIKECNDIILEAIKKLDEFVISQKTVLNYKLKELTGCSLLYYIEDIY